VPLPLNGSVSDPEAEEPEAFKDLRRWRDYMVRRSEWRAQPPKRVRRWIDAARAYLVRQHEIIAGLGDWSAEAAMLDPRRSRDAKRLVEAFAPQREALDRLLAASADYEAALRQVRKYNTDYKLRPHETPYDPTTLLSAWQHSRRWAVVPGGGTVRIIHEALVPNQARSWRERELVLTVNGLRFTAASVDQIASHSSADELETAGDTAEVEWDERSLELADQEIARLWAPIRHEHNLPADFASAWRVLYGSDHRSLSLASPWQFRARPAPARSHYTHGNWGSGGGGFDGSAGGFGGGDSGGGGDGGGGGE
jgi:uncharacterized membrane protein YgcG